MATTIVKTTAITLLAQQGIMPAPEATRALSTLAADGGGKVNVADVLACLVNRCTYDAPYLKRILDANSS